MNRARLVAALIAAVGGTITVTGAGSALWLYRHEPVASRGHLTVLPPASSAPSPQSAIGNPGPMHYVGVVERDTATSYRPPTLFTSAAGRPSPPRGPAASPPSLPTTANGAGHSGPSLLPRPPGPELSCWCTCCPGTRPWPPSPPGIQTATCTSSPQRSAATAATSSSASPPRRM